MGKIIFKKKKLKRATKRRIGLTIRFVLVICVFFTCGFVAQNYIAPKVKAQFSFLDKQITNMGLVVKNVEFSNIENASQLQLHKASKIRLGQNILTLDIVAARESMLKNNWVRDVVIERQIPDSIFIKVQERQPVALWQSNGDLFLIDEFGSIIEGADLMKFVNLPLVVGEEAPERASFVFAKLQEMPEIYENIRSISWVSERRWNIGFKNGMIIKLPEEDMDIAWKQLADIALAEEFKTEQIKEIDLRLPGKIFIKK